MKRAGLIGGMSWESTVLYYQWINEGIRRRVGGLHSAPILLASVDFAEIESLQRRGEWTTAGDVLVNAAKSVQAGGADFLVICTNTMHKVSAQISAAVDLPLIHIVDPTANSIISNQFHSIGLLGTAFTMEDEFYKGRMAQQHDIDIIVPDEKDRTDVHRIIYNELCQGIVSEESKRRYLEIVQALHAAGAEGVILGCTEITMLINQTDTTVPLFDTTRLHADAIVDRILS